MAESQRSGCLGFLLKLFGIGTGDRAEGLKPGLPYRLRDKFLSPAELSFYRILVQAVGQQFSINNKVRLWDVLYVPRQEGSRSFENKISSKHIDFLLCDPTTMQPLLAVELDDASHNRKDRQERDAFVDDALAAAGLPILHVPAARTYSIAEVRNEIGRLIPMLAEGTGQVTPSVTPPPDNSSAPTCPKCEAAMVKRKAAKGKHAGKRFWASSNYPGCREIIAID
ncbi:DUF2726 domain-containing protein [Rhodopirellula sp. MGV]|uniref:DUF2726 domain-containing protein n=1 Tax=Rhodopirellula sp. MGV TaxID=2023130 RepID=UPI000B9714C3|nr:DUF2726 domain-containing protein [Rhodopirellula sp. MGV]OYP37220.1 hypothetical protein CGZ80_05895 [Rhodopirellula sp. MGV]PNY34139.1 DUF2726 domain-containing protein [Rhodopirellula baltica]